MISEMTLCGKGLITTLVLALEWLFSRMDPHMCLEVPTLRKVFVAIGEPALKRLLSSL